MSNTANCLCLPEVKRDVNLLVISDKAPFGALNTAELIMTAITAGCFAFITWTFSDYSDSNVCHYADHDDCAKKWVECEYFISHSECQIQ